MKKEKIFKIFIILIMVLVILAVAYYIKNLEKTSFENHEFYQYFGNMKFEYTGNLEISKETNGITNLTMNDVELQLGSIPIYYKDVENRLIFPEDMAIVFTNGKFKIQRINYFSELQLESNIISLNYQDKKMGIKDAVLYDGDDMYVFIEPTTLTVGDQTFELSPLSYVIASFRNNVEIYQKDKDTVHIIENVTHSNVFVKNEKYELNLITDSLSLEHEEESRLLLNKLELLPAFEWKI